MSALARLLVLFAFSPPWQQPASSVRELSHMSQVLGRTRAYRAVVPAWYEGGRKRYPVIYWLYGYEQPSEQREAEIAAFVAAHDVIVVYAGPVETTGTYPLYFAELVQSVDSSLRTIPDRDHRAVAGTALGGFMALWTAGKFPDLVASASSLDPFAEATVGPAEFPAECGAEDGAYNYDAVRTLPLAHGVAEMLDFHAAAFAAPQPKPAVFSHADVYPDFTVWGWQASSDRRQPGFTVIENAGASGFRSSVREWLPGGGMLASVKLSIVTAARLYVAGSPHTVTYIRLRDGNVRRANQKADSQGRLAFELDGEAYEVGVSAEPLLIPAGYEVSNGAWATAGKPVDLRVKFWNKGAARSATALIKWEAATPGVTFASPTSRVFALGPGESASVPVTFTSSAPGRAVRLVAVEGTRRMPVDVPVFPPSENGAVFQIADGAEAEVWRHGSQRAVMTLGEGNADHHAGPGESFALLFPDGEYLRAAEVFTNDTCVDTTVRASDTFGENASAKYSLPSIRESCEPGHVVHMLGRVVKPGSPPRYYAVEFPVWYRR